MPSGPNGSHDPKIAEEEWNFEAKRIDEDEVNACLVYEYARERAKHSTVWQNSMIELRRRQRLPKGHPSQRGFISLFERIFQVFGSTNKFWPEWGHPGFVASPWQSLPSKGRERLVTRYIEQKEVPECYQESITLLITLLRDLPEYSAAGANDFGSWVILDRCSHVGKPQREYGFIAINWDYTDDFIKAEFAAWLDKKRGNRKAVKSRQGKEKPVRYLKALGAKRLLDAGFTVTAAMAYSEKFLRDQHSNPRPLYNAPRSWYKARSKTVPFVMVSLFGDCEADSDGTG